MTRIEQYLRVAAILTGISLMDEIVMAGPAEPSLRITLHVHNRAHVESGTLLRAEQEATRIFSEIGIEAVWIEESLVATEEHQDHPRHRMSDVHLNILPRAMEDLGLSGSALGVAPGIERNRGWAYVFYDRVEDLSRKQVAAMMRREVSRRATPAQILGYAMAHEIGHLFGLNAHSAAGIMRANWRGNDLLHLAYGNLVFTPQQATVIRSEVLSRQ